MPAGVDASRIEPESKMWAKKMPSESQKSLPLSSPPYSRSKRDAVFGQPKLQNLSRTMYDQ